MHRRVVGDASIVESLSLRSTTTPWVPCRPSLGPWTMPTRPGEDGWCHVGVDELTILGVGDVEVYKRIA
jgi:hypothetical protein